MVEQKTWLFLTQYNRVIYMSIVNTGRDEFKTCIDLLR